MLRAHASGKESLELIRGMRYVLNLNVSRLTKDQAKFLKQKGISVKDLTILQSYRDRATSILS